MADKPVIHYIRMWSSDPTDESPVCGADKYAPEVWGNRTQFVRHVTCEECLKRIGQQARSNERPTK
jgi:hypothetical protein